MCVCEYVCVYPSTRKPGQNWKLKFGIRLLERNQPFLTKNLITLKSIFTGKIMIFSDLKQF